MKKVKLPLPLLWLFLILMWLLLNGSLSPGQWLLGALFATLISWAVAKLRPLPAWPHRLHVAMGLIYHVTVDIIRSNWAVGRIILGASADHQPHIGFMQIPLELRDPHGLAILSMIVTATPGTVWAGHDPEHDILTLHVLDLVDEAVWVRTIKQRYEGPLREIFE